MNYDAAFKNIDDALWKDAGCGSELDYIEQTSWILFLKYLDDYEKEKRSTAELDNQSYSQYLMMNILGISGQLLRKTMDQLIITLLKPVMISRSLSITNYSPT